MKFTLRDKHIIIHLCDFYKNHNFVNVRILNLQKKDEWINTLLS